MIEVTVVELVVESGDFEDLRRWAGPKIRKGDGFFAGEGRMFFILPNVAPGGLESFLSRLGPEVAQRGGRLAPRTNDEDPQIESIVRRAKAQIFPVEVRPQGRKT